MAIFKDRVPENVQGRYYVDCSCTACEACTDLAPANIGRAAHSNAYVKKQPANEAEEAACREAVNACPHEAIGDDGNSYDWSAIPPYDMEAARESLRRYLEEFEGDQERKRWWKLW